MQKLSLYLVPNRVVVIADISGYITEYRQMYQRKIKLFKGINQTITFDVKNSDQKRVDVRDYTPIISVFDIEHKLLMTKSGTVNPITPGLFTVLFTAQELSLIQNQSLTLTAYLSNQSGDTVLYSDAQTGLGITVELDNGVIAADRPPSVLKNFQLNWGESKYFSEITPFGPAINDDVSSDSSKTTVISYYPDTFRGLVEVEATTNQSMAIGNTWTTIASNMVSSSTPFDISIAGNYTFIRFKFPRDAGMFDKILVLN